jgi:hypothetical protein
METAHWWKINKLGDLEVMSNAVRTNTDDYNLVSLAHLY